MTHRAHTSDRTVPENSVSSVEDAIDSGAEVIECDTHVTSDGVVVVCHDQTINATTNGTGDITKMTYAEIQKYNLKDRNGRVTDEKDAVESITILTTLRVQLLRNKWWIS